MDRVNGIRVVVALLSLCAIPIRTQETDGMLEDIEEMKIQVASLRSALADLTRHTMLSEFQATERIRSEGTSGIVKVRDYTVGADNYHFASHIGQSYANIHDHANHEKTYGLGDFQVVMNGIHFRTRHNDFELRKVSTTSSDWLATEPIELPPLPPGLESLSVEDQMTEMREYFRAFQYQDTSIKDYKPYFKPVLCYLEGWWDANVTDIENGFTSNRHEFSSRTWADQADKARADANLGSEFDFDHDDASLPVAILGIDQLTGLPIYGQWNYRVLCHPIEEDVPLSSFKPVEDFAYRAQRLLLDENQMYIHKGARYILDTSPIDEALSQTVLDKYVSQIPGLDGHGAGTLSESAYNRYDSGNLAFYNRAYKTPDEDSLYSMNQLRGFSDGNVFVALNTQDRVAPLVVNQCVSRTNCPESHIRFSTLLPLEVIYMTPLQSWNPYNLVHSTVDSLSDFQGDNDGKSEEKAVPGSHDRFFYRIPKTFFSETAPTDKIPADTYSNARYTRNEQGDVVHMLASGPRTILPPIEGAGEVRLRFPIMPVHEEGSGVWKELNGFFNYLHYSFDLTYTEDELMSWL